MEELLDEVEGRVLGCLLEKEMATPEYCPLSLNALINACNQKSNREPVVSFEDTIVSEALARLSAKKLAWRSDAARVPKYSQSFVKKYNLLTKEAALICLLLVRGPQTLGQLRGRTERMYSFDDLAEVEHSLNNLAEMDMVVKLPRQAGRKESRYGHLFFGEPDIEAVTPFEEKESLLGVPGREDRLSVLEKEVVLLRDELDALKEELVTFKKQFD